MSEPAPAPASAPPAPSQGTPVPGHAVTVDNSGLPGHILSHVRDWFGRDVEPDLEAAKADLERVRELAPSLGKLAGVVEALAKAAPGISPQVAADAGEAAAAVARITGELAAAGM